MVVIGIDPHKHTHTAVAVDEVGRKLGQVTVAADEAGVLRLWVWAGRFGQRRWAVEDGRAVAGRLVRTLIGMGSAVVWVPPKLMVACRASARTRGKSDPIDALAIARAALREPRLPAARLDQVALDLRLLIDRRETVVAARTAAICRLRWHLHDLAPGLDEGTRTLTGRRRQHALTGMVAALPASVRRDIALDLLADITRLTEQILILERRLSELVTPIAPTLMAIVGINVLAAAKLIGEVADITRFRSPAAFAMHTGTAPIPVWSSNTPQYRLNRGGNRQLNTCLHRIALIQLIHHPPAQQFRDRWTQQHPHATKKAAIRALKRHLTNVIYHALQTDHHHLT
ncbi:transposase [Amycolatopsis bartoniae]|uniref:IS110 family transposase n=1 Tax=Amycolatopsis bartoniae TaxID=941986 RepID=UPI0011964BAD|nr:IS110 family transposase [Amycolatopsis bartoniae]MBB2934204.1 transposase [Amycolatopsis bartoniae]MBB2935003.1 transposase [Amycolatopsis bartoniae]MBB2935258.1 transposase [Amycolatopsis bartoniae]MBB2936100.1 transposase [Amycolatopsis bartoniae]MBB2938849.1 transposase [Amycolatopsis bartoniae]